MEDFSSPPGKIWKHGGFFGGKLPEVYEVMVHDMPWRWFGGPHDLGKLYGNGGFFARYHEKRPWKLGNIIKHGNLLEVIVGSKSWAHCPYWGMVIKPFNFSHYKGHQYGIYDQTTYLLMYIPWPWHVWFSQVLAPLYLGCPLLGVSWIHWGLPPRLAIWTWGIPERLRHRFRGHLPLNCFKHPKKIDDMCIYIYTVSSWYRAFSQRYQNLPERLLRDVYHKSATVSLVK